MGDSKPSERTPRQEHRRLQPEVPPHEETSRSGSQRTSPLKQKTEYENMRLADQQSATLKRMAYLEDKIETLEQDKKER